MNESDTLLLHAISLNIISTVTKLNDSICIYNSEAVSINYHELIYRFSLLYQLLSPKFDLEVCHE